MFMTALNRFILVALLFIGGAASMQSARADKTGANVQILGRSPDGSILVQRRHTGETGQFVEFVDAKSRKVLFSFRSTWRKTDLVWEKSGRYLCINDETATSGDYVYVFEIKNGLVVLLRAPSPDDFALNLAERLAKMPDPGRFTFAGEKWLNKNQLLAVVSGGHYGESYFETVLQINEDGAIEVINPKPNR
jgi:hypothetical protein